MLVELLKNWLKTNEDTIGLKIFTYSICPNINFFGLNYHHTICELQIDYVVRYNN
jgi:hypothetical protein